MNSALLHGYDTWRATKTTNRMLQTLINKYLTWIGHTHPPETNQQFHEIRLTAKFKRKNKNRQTQNYLEEINRRESKETWNHLERDTNAANNKVRWKRAVSALCSMLYALCSMLYALCSMPYALCSMLYALCPMPYALCSMLYALCSMLYALCPMLYAICSMLYALCPMLYALCSMLYAPCSMLYALCSMLYALCSSEE